MKVFKYTINLKFYSPREVTEYSPFIARLRPEVTGRYFNIPYGKASGGFLKVIEYAGRNRCIEQTSVLMYKESDNNRTSVVNIPQVPYDALRDYLIYVENNQHVCKAFYPSYYNKKIQSQYDIDSISNNQNGFLFDIARTIANRIKNEVANIDDSHRRDLIIEEKIKQYSFYFIYDNINYKDSFVLWQACFLDTANNNFYARNFMIRAVYGIDFLNRNPLLFHAGYGLIKIDNMSSSGKINEKSYLFDVVIPVYGGVQMANSIFTVDHAYVYDPRNGIIKNPASPHKDFYVLNRDTPNTPVIFPDEQVYRYYDYKDNNNNFCTIMGHGFVVKDYLFELSGNLNDTGRYYSMVFANNSGTFQYVPYLTGLLHFLIAIHLGYKPIMMIKNNKPEYKNVERIVGKIEPKSNSGINPYEKYYNYYADLIHKFSLVAVNMNFTQFLERHYQIRLNMVVEKNTDKFFYITDNLSVIKEKIENLSDLWGFFEKYAGDYELVYYAGLGYEELLRIIKEGYYRNNFVFETKYEGGVRFLFSFLTSLEQEPCFIYTFDDIVKNITGEDTPIYQRPSSITTIMTNYDNRYYLHSFPSMILYDSREMKYPITMKNMEVYLDNSSSGDRYVERDYVYPELEDPIKWGVDTPLSSYQYIFYNDLLVDIAGGKIAPPVVDISKTTGSLFNFINHRFIESGDILAYPSIFDGYHTSTTLTFPNEEYKEYSFLNNSINKRRIYWREYIYNKYLRYIINYAIHSAIAAYYNEQYGNLQAGDDVKKLFVYKKEERVNEYGALEVILGIELVIKVYTVTPVSEVIININVS